MEVSGHGQSLGRIFAFYTQYYLLVVFTTENKCSKKHARNLREPRLPCTQYKSYCFRTYAGPSHELSRRARFGGLQDETFVVHHGQTGFDNNDHPNAHVSAGADMNVSDWPDRREYPFESHYFQVAAGNMHYVDKGSGAPVVMLHGNPTWSFLYRKLIQRLSPAYRCIAPDFLGFGLSDKPRDWSYLPEEHAGTLTDLIHELELKNITLVVQDWGGPIGMAYATAHPDNIARVVVMNTWAWPVNRDPHYLVFSLFMGGPIGRMLIRKRNFFANNVMRGAFGDKSRLIHEIHEQYLRALPFEDDRKGCSVFPGQIIGSTPWLRTIRQGLPALRHKPALLVWGMKDIAFREKELRRWQQVFPGAETIRLQSVGHFVQEEAPEELADAVETFLRGTAQVDISWD